MRISVIGPTAGGKSVLAEEISKRFGIPHIELDRIWFESGGRLDLPETERREVRSRIRIKVLPLIEREDWVSDGSYPHIQPAIAERADALVWVDVPLLERMTNHFVRMHAGKRRHAEVGYWDDFKYFAEIVRRYFNGSRKKIKAIADLYAHKLVYLRNRKQIRAYLQGLTENSGMHLFQKGRMVQSSDNNENQSWIRT